MSVVEVYNTQDAILLSDEWMNKFTELVNKALPFAVENPAHTGGVLTQLEVIEVCIVDDDTISEVHADFMNIPGATDVITFLHGEIVVSSETAQVYAKNYGHSMQRELFLYMVHGLLHLSGHEDSDDEERAIMEKIQFTILEELFPLSDQKPLDP